MDQPYAAPFTRGWVNTAEAEPIRDGRYVLFAREEERTRQAIADGQCPYVFGFWHSYQNTPGWCDSYGFKIVLEHWPRWKTMAEV